MKSKNRLCSRIIYVINLAWLMFFLALTLFACTGKSKPSANAESEKKLVKETNEQLEQIYMDFLSGKTNVTTCEKFRADDAHGNYDGLRYGTYSLAELKAAIAESEMTDSRVKYAFVDLARDGKNELVLRFESIDPSFSNWVGIIKYNGTSLDLNYSYEDGYRTFSDLYASGYLRIGGSISALGYTSSVIDFDKNGFGSNVFTTNDYRGMSATSVAYDLKANGRNSMSNYDNMMSGFLVREYVADGKVKISAGEWSDDAAVRQREEKLVAELVKLGAEQISDEEMDKLCSLAPYESDKVTWLEWNGGKTATSETNNADAAISIDYASDDLLAKQGTFHEVIADDSEYQVSLVLRANTVVTNFRVLWLHPVAAGDNGKNTFSCTEFTVIPKLTPEKPLVLATYFNGEIPIMGITYVDGNGKEQARAITQSGDDGKLLLTEVNLIEE